MLYLTLQKYFTIYRTITLMGLLFLLSGCAHEILLPGDIKDPNIEKLTLIHFNDGESHLLNAGAGLEDYGGIARFATVVNNIKKELGSTPYLTISSGDNYLAGPVFNVSLKKGVPYYDAVALDDIGVDAFCLGNHDFDFGPDVLNSFIESFKKTKPVFLGANLVFSDEPELLKFQKSGKIAGAVIIKKNKHKIGIIGLTTPELKDISSPGNVEVRHDLVVVLQNAVDSLNKAGVNKIILISHLQGIKNDIDLIKKTKGIDIVVAGGGGELLINNHYKDIKNDLLSDIQIRRPYPIYVKDADARNVPIVTTPGHYCFVGRIDLSFDSKGEITAVSKNSGPVMVVGDGLTGAVEPERTINEEVVIPVAKAISTLSNLVGVSKVYLDGSKARSMETNLGNLFADAFFWNASRRFKQFKAKEPTVGMINGGAIRSSIPAGQVSDTALLASMPFYDFITIVEDISPKTLKSILENSVSEIVEDGVPSGDTGKFPQLSNMSIIYNPKRKPGERIKQVKLENGVYIVNNYKIVKNAPNVNVATSNFLARGGDDWNFGKAKKINLGLTVQKAIIDYISESNKIGGLNKLILKKQYPPKGNNRIMVTRE